MTPRENARSRKLLNELSNALTARTHEAAKASHELRDAVCDYVAAEQARETSLNVILSTVKQLLARAEGAAGFSSGSMAAQLVEWCLEFHSQRRPTPPEPTPLPTA